MKRRFRLVRSNDFKRVRREGKSFAHPFFVLLIAEGTYQNSKAGISISRSVGKAVTRNRIKRQIRAILNDCLDRFEKNWDILIIVRKNITGATSAEMRSILMGMFERSGIV